MMKKEHGGNIYKKSRETGIPQDRFLDFSANINPLGLPDHIREAIIEGIDEVIHYPDPDCTLLREAIAEYEHVRPEQIVCGNGGADLLYRLTSALSPKTILLPAPSFAEYEEAGESVSARINYYRMGEDLRIHEDVLSGIDQETNLFILCNPNNPTGLLTQRELIDKILAKAEETGTTILVDECFLELCAQWEEYSVVSRLQKYRNLIILKSFTKLYAIPGLRLGYLMSQNTELIDRIAHTGQAWPVGNLAQKAGIRAMQKPEYRDTVLAEVQKELEYMKKELAKLPITLYDGMANYLFFRAPGCTDLDERLLSEGLMIRSCRNYENLGEDYYRVAVRLHEENDVLISTLQNILTGR